MFLESELPIEWELLSKNESAAMEVELARETCWEHDLHNKMVNAIAVKTGFDEILFSVWGTNFLIAVTMTWKYEEIPTLPKFQMYQSKIQFIEECVKGRIVKDY